MRVLISGGSGLVGSSIKELINSTSTKNDYEYMFLSSTHTDLRNSVACEKLFSNGNFDIVIHLAAKVGGLYANMDSNYNMLIDNLKINTNILECCKTYNVKRLINILSTCIFPEENASNNLIYPLTSDQILNGKPHHSNSGYAHAKRMLYVGSKLLSNTSDIQVVNLIPTNLYGKNDNYNIHNSHVIPGLIHKTFIVKENFDKNLCRSTDSFKSNGSLSEGISTNCKLIIKGSGNAKRQFLYVDDFAKVILHFVNCILPKQCNSLIVSPPKEQEITIKSLVNSITKQFDFKGKIIYDTDYPDGQHLKTTDSNELLNFIPNFKFTPFQQGLEENIIFFNEHYETVRK
jgi:GDP-L-fucose synthase